MKTIALFVVLASAAARGQDVLPCVDDTPPAPADFTAPCANPAKCPVDVPGLRGRYTVKVVTYKSVDDVGPCDTAAAYCPIRCEDPRASCERNARGRERCTIRRQGILFTPKPAPRSGPAVVLVSGSVPCTDLPGHPGSCARSCAPGLYSPEQFCGLKTYLLEHNYTVFAIYPRGYNDNTASSTGAYVGQLLPQQVARQDGCAFTHPEAPNEACATFDLEDEGQQDIGDAVRFLKTQAHVDPDKIAVFGHSLGAIRSVSFNQLNLGQRAVVAVAPGSESWCINGQTNVILETELRADVDSARSPFYFFQPRNDQNLNPTVEFSHEAGLNREQYQAAIFPRVRDGAGNPWTFGDMAHFCFVTDQNEVDLWAPTVRDFLRRYGVK